MQDINPEFITAVVAGVLVVLAYLGKRFSSGDKPAPHQELTRPQTAAEIRQAEAMERIAASADKMASASDDVRKSFRDIERHFDLYLNRNR